MRLCRTNQHTGLHSESEHFSIPLGTRDGGITPSRSADIIPAGSLAKPFTAVGVMQLVERGLVELDDPIPPHIDTFLHAINGTTLEELWGPTVNNVTIRMLLNMRSCLADYNNSQILAYTLDYPDWDLSPLDYLAFTRSRKSEFECMPGTHSHYSSTNFMLLGLVWAQHTQGCTSWDKLDQSSVVPAGLSDDIIFFERGRCAKYPNVVHYYDHTGTNHTTGLPTFTDMFQRRYAPSALPFSP
jgi:D-alanyl-D-alanine carboxypeptidase